MAIESEYVLLKEISQELKIPERTLLFYLSKGDFPAVYKFGRHRRVKRSDYESWKAQHLEK